MTPEASPGTAWHRRNNDTAAQAAKARPKRPPDAQRWPVCGNPTVADLLARHPRASLHLTAQITGVLAHDALHHTNRSRR